ncbi:MAG: hypothetical protein ABH833_04055 [Parcubacteria group bacterium]
MRQNGFGFQILIVVAMMTFAACSSNPVTPDTLGEIGSNLTADHAPTPFTDGEQGSFRDIELLNEQEFEGKTDRPDEVFGLMPGATVAKNEFEAKMDSLSTASSALVLNGDTAQTANAVDETNWEMFRIEDFRMNRKKITIKLFKKFGKEEYYAGSYVDLWVLNVECSRYYYLGYVYLPAQAKAKVTFRRLNDLPCGPYRIYGSIWQCYYTCYHYSAKTNNVASLDCETGGKTCYDMWAQH